MILDALWNKIVLFYKKVKIGDNITLKGRIIVQGAKAGIRIGENCIIRSSALDNPTSGFNHTYLFAKNIDGIIIGRNVGISNAVIYSREKVIIEDNVLIGSGVKIWDTDFHSLDYEERIGLCKENPKTAPVVIKEGAFIGACSIILKGVTVGKKAIVGAGSVVTKNIPAGEVWAGNPAKYIKESY